MRRISWGLLCLMLSILGSLQGYPLAAQVTAGPPPQYVPTDPFLGKNQYPQYRNLSGLAGGGYGTDAQGRRSESGPTAFSTPTAFVLGHDSFFFADGGANFRGALSLDERRLNGTVVGTYGHTFGQFNIAFTDFIKSYALDQVYNLQIGLIPVHKNRLGFSIGVQDGQGRGGSAGAGQPTDRNSSQSIFGVFTYPVDVGSIHPLFVSAGVGTHRFGNGFGSASYWVGGPLRTYLEYDGFGFNEGILLYQKVGRGRGSFDVNGNVGLLRGKFLAFSLGVGF